MPYPVRFEQRREETARILWTWLDQEIEIESRSRDTVQDGCDPANDDVSHIMTLKRREHFLEPVEHLSGR